MINYKSINAQGVTQRKQCFNSRFSDRSESAAPDTYLADQVPASHCASEQADWNSYSDTAAPTLREAETLSRRSFPRQRRYSM